MTLALELRAKAGIKVRQPLARLEAPQLPDALKSIVADEVNVKEIIEGAEVKLDMILTPELKEEGQLRDLIRNIQDMRKTRGLVPEDKITLFVAGDEPLCTLIKKYEAEFAQTANVIKLAFEEHEGGAEVKIDGAALRIAIAKT